ncbi:MAG TPA: hypothetical protein VGQ05_06135 [Streptosporangiaceae bacterium]|nr:hypothetical protein [Streptosporangiaceae bacterium]
MALDEAVDLARTGDIWLFRGRTPADRAIQLATNSPVNHVGMAVVLGDLPPLMWHAELGRSLPDVWSGARQRGVQLHVLSDAVMNWVNRYGQRAWVRQLSPEVTAAMEDAVLRVIARMDGTPFPSTVSLASRWVTGRLPPLRRPRRRAGEDGGDGGAAALETAYCAEVLAVTYQAMGLLPAGRRPGWYDAGRFWSGDDLQLDGGYSLGGELTVQVPPAAPTTRNITDHH